MIDFGILNAFRHALIESDDFKEAGGAEHIYFHLPTKAFFPCVVLEIEEIWNSLSLGREQSLCKMKIKASTLSQQPSSRESISIADCIRREVDGRIFSIDLGRKAIVRLANSVIDMPTTLKPASVQQYFEVLVRG